MKSGKALDLAIEFASDPLSKKRFTEFASVMGHVTSFISVSSKPASLKASLMVDVSSEPL